MGNGAAVGSVEPSSTDLKDDINKYAEQKQDRTSSIHHREGPGEVEINGLNISSLSSEMGHDKVLSDQKMKKLALGIQSYKETQRDYDSTLSTVLTRNTQVEWVEPLNTSHLSKKPNLANNSSTGQLVAPSSPYSGAKKPPGLPPNHLIHNAEIPSSPSKSVSNHSSSFNNKDLPPKASIKGQPPPGVAVRPFPKPGEDYTDDYIADFADRQQIQKIPSKPQNVPPLAIMTPQKPSNPNPNPSQTAYLGNSPSTGSASPALSTQIQISSKITGPPQIKSVMPPMMSGPPRMIPVMVPAQSIAGSPVIGPVVVAVPGVVPSGAGAALQPRPPAGSTPLPIVKETKDVKRNKAQLPSNLNHAKPTTGDWLNKRYIVNNYILLDILGTGSYGEVRLCKDRTTEGLYAIKIISKDFLKKKKTGKSAETYFEDIKREIAIMKKLLHPNILRLYEVLDDPKVNKMYLVLEYMKMGDLVNILQKRGLDGTGGKSTSEGNSANFVPLKDPEVWHIFRQLIAGIKYLHFQNIVHGDIKPQNLLLGEDGVLKIADFGISQMLSASSQQIVDAAGTPAFMAPELCENRSFSGQLADVWAIGATVFMLRFGNPPFVAKSIINLYYKICNDPLVFPGPIEPAFQNMLEGLLQKDPEKRMTMASIVNHAWYRFPPVLTPRSILGPPSLSQSPSVKDSLVISESAPSQGPSANAHSHTQSNIMGTKVSFQPPDSYSNEADMAMKEPIKLVDNSDIHMSIGGINFHSFHIEDEMFDGAVDEVDLDDDEDEEMKTRAAAKRSNAHAHAHAHAEKRPDTTKEEKSESKENSSDNNLMDTNWGNDVFKIVDDDGDADGDDDDDDDDDYVDSEAEKADDSFNETSLTNLSTKRKKNKSQYSMGVKKKDSHSQMSQEEESRRSHQFKKKANNRSIASMKSIGGSSDNIRTVSTLQGRESSLSITSSESDLSPIRGKSHRQVSMSSAVDFEEDTEELTAEAFQQMMDTLAQQPAKSGGDESLQEDMLPLPEASVRLDDIIVKYKNPKTRIGGAYFSEQGIRPSQEDRCVLLANLAKMKALETLAPSMLEQYELITLCCIFDGHSGWKTSQYLSQNLPGLLASHAKFLDSKNLDKVIQDTFNNIDLQICQLLREEEDSSGSTGVVVIYDGRRRTLTVAGVGDSLCIISRNGRAVEMNKMHRLDNENEKERVKKAGGTIINNRVNGVLAVSRAFGDTQFKSPPAIIKRPGAPPPPSLVVATPDIHTEVITPKTEFAIIATDGLWDVINPQAAVTFVHSRLTIGKDLQKATKELTSEALSRGSVDNISVILLTFNSTFTAGGTS